MVLGLLAIATVIGCSVTLLTATSPKPATAAPNLPQPVVASAAVPRHLVPPTPTATMSPTAAVPKASYGIPTAVTIPSIGVLGEEVIPQGIVTGSQCGRDAPQGCILPPGQKLVWNSTTVQPGQPGVAVIAGHDYAEGSEAKFWNLYKVPEASLITLRVVNGKDTWNLILRVDAKKPELKTAVQTDPAVQDVHSTSLPEVVFITCNPSYGLYQDNTGRHAYYNEVVTTEVISATAV